MGRINRITRRTRYALSNRLASTARARRGKSSKRLRAALYQTARAIRPSYRAQVIRKATGTALLPHLSEKHPIKKSRRFMTTLMLLNTAIQPAITTRILSAAIALHLMRSDIRDNANAHRLLARLVGKHAIGKQMLKRLDESPAQPVVEVLTQQRFLTPDEIRRAKATLSEGIPDPEVARSLQAGFRLTQIAESDPPLARQITNYVFKHLDNTPESRETAAEFIEKTLQMPDRDTQRAKFVLEWGVNRKNKKQFYVQFNRTTQKWNLVDII